MTNIKCTFCKSLLKDIVCENHKNVSVVFGSKPIIDMRTLKIIRYEIVHTEICGFGRTALTEIITPDLTIIYIPDPNNTKYDKNIGEFKGLNITPENFKDKTDRILKILAFS